MQRCLQLAGLGAGYVAPNPLVGAVLEYNGRIIGEGWHRQYGKAHAEVNCLHAVAAEDKHLIKESTLYVSLEPCAHYGKTPPCAHRIVQEGIKKVVIGTVDPYKEVAGRGIAILQDAGIKVEKGILNELCRWQNRRFFTFHEKKRPYVHLKWAETADAFIAASNSRRLKISGEVTDRLVHKWRSEELAIMIGTQTALVDNPSLTNRIWWGADPVRIVLDRNLSLPQSLTLFNDTGTTWVLNERMDGLMENKRLVKGSDLSPATILEILYVNGIQSVLIEGGARVLNSFLETGLWDETHIIVSSNIFAGLGTAAPKTPSAILKESFSLGNDRINRYVNE